jgi:predicted dienelactone hydrolase
MPVVIWSHGGAEGKRDPANSMAEWSTVSERAGYFSIAIAHARRDGASRNDLCTSIGMDSETCRLFAHLNWDRPHDIRTVLDELERMAMGELRGVIDMHKIASLHKT